jgi:phosphonate transport system substrate-binding protein
MRTHSAALTSAAALVVVMTLGACGAEATGTSAATDPDAGTFASGDSQTLVFATVPDRAGTDASWKPLEDYISQETGFTVEFKPTNDYAALIAAGVAGQVDVGVYSASTYTLAMMHGARFELVSAIGVDPDASMPGYYSEAIVPVGSPIDDLADFQGRTICFVSPQSNSGFFFPLLTLKSAGISVESRGDDANGDPVFKDFTAYFAGTQDKSVAAVEAGQCEVGFAEDKVVELSNGVRVVDRRLVPGDALVVSSALPVAVKAKLVATLSELTVADFVASGIEVTSAFEAYFQFSTPVDPSFYDPLVEICETIPAAKCGG